jgi:hypothetical protein
MDEKEMCLFRNPSDSHWVVILAQLSPEHLKLEPNLQRHEPVAFLSGCFLDSQERWSVIEKETFSNIAATEKLRHFLVRNKRFTIFIHRRNFV